MTGALCAAACSGAAVPIPLSASVGLSGGGSTFNVSGASGNLYTALGVVVTSADSGGTGNYVDTVTVTNDAGVGSISLALSGDHIHNTIAWSGLAVGQTALFHINLHVDDGNTVANARYPSAGAIAIKRTS